MRMSSLPQKPLKSRFFLALLFLVPFFTYCVEDNRYSFVYDYDVPSHVTFDFRKEYSAYVGSVTLLNTTDKTKKFRYINHSPLGYFFNKRTKKIKALSLVPHSSAPEKMDSLFWALLGSGTSHTPVQAQSSITLKLFLNMNFNPQPKEMINYVIKNHKDLEYHIFNPADFPSTGAKAGKPPTAVIRSFSVLLVQ